MVLIFLLLSILSLLSPAVCLGVGFTIASVDKYVEVAQSNSSTLYQAIVNNYPGDPIEVVVLRGSRFQMGYDYGAMTWKQALANYDNLLTSILGTGLKAEAEKALLEEFLDFHWRNHLAKQTPQQYLDEMRGLTAGGNEAGAPVDVAKLNQRIIVLANFPSDTSDLTRLLWQEFLHEKPHYNMEPHRSALRTLIGNITPFQCSMWSAWGSRLADGTMYGGRNLDWNKDTGVNKHKSIIVFNPSDGAIPHAVLGFQGMLGALTGMSSAGLFVTEANLEENLDTFDGFPWVIRLRWIMENASKISTAQAMWASTNNTVGFNHMVASGFEVPSSRPAAARKGPWMNRRNPNSKRNGDAPVVAVSRKDDSSSSSSSAPIAPPAMVMETMATYSAYFNSMDSRENGATWINPHTNATVVIGAPLPEAIFRTNHGYDPMSRSHYQWNLGGGAGADSLARYFIIHDTILGYEQSNTLMNVTQAVNVTAAAGSKGGDKVHCVPAHYNDGSNVLSVSFHPTSGKLWAAWELGTGKTWTPACCGWYTEIDLSQFW